MTLLAFTAQNRRQISDHAGRCRHFLVTRLGETGEPGAWETVSLARHETLHESHAGLPAPLAAVHAVITRGAGPGLARRLARSGVQVLLTEHPDPQAALQAWRAGVLTPVPTSEPAGAGAHGRCSCGH